jgi:hypothetical protein
MLAISSCPGLKYTLGRPCPAADTAAYTWRRGNPSNRSSSSSRCSRQLRLKAGANASASTVVVPNPQGPGYPAFQAELQLPAGAEVYQVSLKKPLGLTLTGVHMLHVFYICVVASRTIMYTTRPSKHSTWPHCASAACQNHYQHAQQITVCEAASKA